MRGGWLLHGWLFLCFCALVASGAVAQEKAHLSAIPPDAFSFVGSWDCTGQFRSGKVHKALFTGQIVVGDTWLELTERDLEPATGYVAKYLLGYDAEHKRLVEFDANNFGASTYSSGDGWQNRALIMSSEVSQDAKAPYAANRFRYSITGKDTFTVDWEVSKTADLKWTSSDHLECKRRASE